MRRWVILIGLTWVLRWFNTAEEMVVFLNRLSPERQVEAKVVIAPSARNPVGWLGSPYGLLYREERDAWSSRP